MLKKSSLENILLNLKSKNFKQAKADLDTAILEFLITADISKEERTTFLNSLLDFAQDFGAESKKITEIFGGTRYANVKYDIFNDGKHVQNAANITLKGVKPYKYLSFLTAKERSLLALYPVLDPSTKKYTLMYFRKVLIDHVEGLLAHWQVLKNGFVSNIKDTYFPMVEADLKDMYSLLEAEGMFKKKITKKQWDDNLEDNEKGVYTELEEFAVEIFDSLESYFISKMQEVSPSNLLKNLHEMFSKLFQSHAIARVTAKDNSLEKTINDNLHDMHKGIFKILKKAGATEEVYNLIEDSVLNPLKKRYKKELKRDGGLISELTRVLQEVVPEIKEIGKHLEEKSVSPDNVLKGVSYDFAGNDFDGVFSYKDGKYKIESTIKNDAVVLTITHPFEKDDLQQIFKKVKPDADEKDIQEVVKNISDERFLDRYESKMKDSFLKGLKSGTKKLK